MYSGGVYWENRLKVFLMWFLFWGWLEVVGSMRVFFVVLWMVGVWL